MNLYSEQVKTLNKIMSTIDEKAALYKETRFDMRGAQSDAQKKLLLDLIKSATELAHEMKPSPKEVLDDLGRLTRQINDMR